MASVEGLARLNAKLDRLPKVARKRIHDALEANAKELVSAQKTLAARSRRTGKLMNSIKAYEGDHDLSIQVQAGDGEAYYARFVEFGTVRTSAKPFFFPPYRLLKKKLKSRVKSAIGKSVKEVIGGG